MNANSLKIMRTYYGYSTPNEWELDAQGNVSIYVAERNQVVIQDIAKCSNINDAEFIAFAHNCFPQIIDEIERLRLELNETYVDDYYTVWTRPTAEAYALTCGALCATKEDNNHFLAIINDCRNENMRLQGEIIKYSEYVQDIYHDISTHGMESCILTFEEWRKTNV